MGGNPTGGLRNAHGTLDGLGDSHFDWLQGYNGGEKDRQRSEVGRDRLDLVMFVCSGCPRD